MKAEDKFVIVCLIAWLVLFYLAIRADAYMLNYAKPKYNPLNYAPNITTQYIKDNSSFIPIIRPTVTNIVSRRITLNEGMINEIENLKCDMESWGVQIGCYEARDRILELLGIKKNTYKTRPSTAGVYQKYQVCYPERGGFIEINFNNTTKKVEFYNENMSRIFHNVTLDDKSMFKGYMRIYEK